MGADRFIRRASGLLVPKMEFAAPWRFLPCESCCDEGCPTCTCVWCDGGNGPATMLVTFAGITNSGCSDCGDMNTTFVLDWFNSSCNWRIDISGFACNYTTINLNIGAGLITVNLFNTTAGGGGAITFRYTFPVPSILRDCSAFSGLVATHAVGSSTDCVESSATATITSG